MTTTTLEPTTPTTVSTEPTLREALTAHLEKNGFQYSYTEAFARVDVAGIPIFVPNIPARRRVLPYHDLHHTVTGYQTDLAGEGEISAWELAADCGPPSHWFAYGINMQGLLLGLAVAPRRTWRAFLRGRRSTSLYRETIDDALLDSPLSEVMARAGLDRPVGEATREDRLAFAGWLFAALAASASVVLPPLVGAALGLAWWGGWLG